MLLKCRYLSQFSVGELSKNASNIAKVADKCPFMVHAKRTLSSNITNETENNNSTVVVNEKNVKSEKLKHHHQQEHHNLKQSSEIGCTNSINCPFFKSENIDLSKLIVKRDYANLNESNAENAKHEGFNVMTSHNKYKKHHKHHNNSVDHQKPLSAELNEGNKLFDYDHFFKKKIQDKKNDGSYRYFKKIVRDAESFPNVHERIKNERTREITIWCSNDYLGLGRHPYVQSKVIEAVKKYGAGSGGTRNISGSTPLHDELEYELARLHKKDSALLFTSCYVANDTTLYTMSKMLPHCHILSDAGNHASMIQGIRNSGIPKTIVRHNDTEHLETILKNLPKHTPKIVAFESVHSMDGSIADIGKMCDITHQYGGIAFVDEVHAVGLYGHNGGGVGERDGILDKMDIITGTLGKAFGNIGGYIAGSADFVDSMRSYGSGFIFTTSLPPSVIAGALAAIKISRSNEGRELRAKHQLYAKIVKEKLINAGLPVMNSPSHIVPVMVGNVKHANLICDRLLNEFGIYIQAINYPTVARGEERLRIVPNPHHTPEMIEKLVDSLIYIWKSMGLDLTKEHKHNQREHQKEHQMQ